MTITAESTLPDVAFEVCSALQAVGITAILTGGSAATVYAPGAYQSLDLDFIIEFAGTDSQGAAALTALGFHRVRQHYEHPDCRYMLDFPSGPLAVGGELLRSWNTMSRGLQILHIISPTDSVRDRLAGFLYWNDRAALAQAVAVATACGDAFQAEVVRNWCLSEGRAEAWREFERMCRTNETRHKAE